ncbi:MAG: PKD domain-containing protein [Balneola sp.]|jgi:PKD repeat protein
MEKTKTFKMKASFSMVLILGVLFISCKNSPVSSIDEKEVTKDELQLVQSSAIQSSTQSVSSGNIVIDDFNGPTGSWSGDFPGLYTYLEDETVLGSARELRSYRSGVTRINGSDGTLEWGGTNTSTEYALYYGNFIGSHGTPTKGSSPNADKKVFLNLDIGLEGALILEILNVSEANDQVTVYLSSTDAGWFYYTNVPLTEGVVEIPLSSFNAFEYNTPMPAEAAADIDGFRLDGFAHNDQGTAGTGTVFGQIAYRSGSTSNIYISNSSVQTYDPIFPSFADRGWTSTVCFQGNTFGIDANWSNPHNAFEVTQDNGQPHPWEDNAGYSWDAKWINSANTMNSTTTSDINGNTGPGGHNWSKYEIPVSGNGDFVVQLLADNCSWIYLGDQNGQNPQLIGYQGTGDENDSAKGKYGVTLDGDHLLTFVIFDGGGLAGGKFRLETTESFGGTPPPPIEPDNEAPIADAGVDQTINATGQTTTVILDGSGSSDPDGDALSYSWSLNGNEVAAVSSFSSDLEAGTYIYTLTVSDGELTGSDDVTVTIVNSAPIADAGKDQSVIATGQATSITLNGSASSDADGDALSYSWILNGSEVATGVSPTVQLAVGSYIYTLTVTDPAGESSSDNVTVEVLNVAPEAVINAGNAVLGSSVSFSGSASSDANGDDLSYAWDFGDGNTATGENVTHDFSNSGNISVTLTVTDSYGATGTATATVSIAGRPFKDFNNDGLFNRGDELIPLAEFEDGKYDAKYVAIVIPANTPDITAEKLDIKAEGITVTSRLVAVKDMKLDAKKGVINAQNSVLEAGKKVYVKAKESINISGATITAKDVKVYAKTDLTAVQATITAEKEIKLKGKDSMDLSYSVLTSDKIKIDSKTSLNITGTVFNADKVDYKSFDDDDDDDDD